MITVVLSLTQLLMTPTLAKFLDHLRDYGVTPAGDFVASKWIDNSQSAPSLVFPAADDSVGALTVYDDGEELTIEIGHLHHTHFSAYNYDGETNEQRLAAANKDAARFLTDVFADRVYFTVDYAGERCIGSSHGYLDSGDYSTGSVRLPDAPLFHNEATTSERFVWSGPLNKS